MDLRLPNTRDRTIQIRDVIHGSIDVDACERHVIDTPFFQRLRNIRQLGFADLAYPCATHTRYSHSIGAMFLAGQAFRNIFAPETFSSAEVYEHYFRLVRLAALLHDIGHGPLSHTTEFAMPKVAELKLPEEIVGSDKNRQATHEDYTLKILLESSLTPVIEQHYAHLEITPRHVAALLCMELEEKDDFFVDKNVSYRKIFHQIISSEIDADRMDYLKRDSYYTGVSYGQYELHWLLSNLTYHITSDSQDPRNHATAHLALSNRAIYTFEDFLLSRYHMFLMVYHHHKSVVYEQMLERYLTSPDCTFKLPGDIEAYAEYDDFSLWFHLRSQKSNEWARRIATRQPYHLSYEYHSAATAAQTTGDEKTLQALRAHLKKTGTNFIETKNRGLVSKYVKGGSYHANDEIFVMISDRLNAARFVPLESVTELFRRYETQNEITRIFTADRINMRDVPGLA